MPHKLYPSFVSCVASFFHFPADTSFTNRRSVAWRGVSIQRSFLVAASSWNSSSSPLTRPTPRRRRCGPRIRARFADLHAERGQLDAQLETLAQATPKAADTTLLDELPFAGDILPGLAPDLKAALFEAFDLQILWNKPGRQATVFVEITEATLQALPGILNPGRDGYDDNIVSIPGQRTAVEDLFESPIGGFTESPNRSTSSARRLTIEATFRL
jgi:hypothetical protein